MRKTFILSTGKDLELIPDLKSYLTNRGLEVRETQNINGQIVIQARTPQPWKKFLGLFVFVNCLLIKENDKIIIELSNLSWIDKAVLAFATFFLYYFLGLLGGLLVLPFLVTCLIGVYRQIRLPFEIWDFVNFGKTASSKWEIS